ncbi:MAG TPA: DNA-3-methyladenine glycosylase 2 family protein [Devosia sp.]|nr:DNA-3-methyladenine glycosylase 2 family protein [Devosia sp.]
MSPEPLSASTTAEALKARLDTPELLAAHLSALTVLDPRLAPILDRAAPISLRTGQKGFAGMARVICGQQLSTASAAAIWARVSALPGAAEPAGFLALDDATLRAAGLSRAKVVSMRAAAEAVLAGTLDFAAVEDLPAEAAIAHLTAVKGVGPWTAELYLLFSVGHPDIFPAGDLALKKAVKDGLGLEVLPSTKALVEIARAWSPHRGAAALLFWRYFRVLNNREGVAA